ncbi:MAG: DUF6044 family protein, partial [Campylobacterota bacterium]|nr:DUF6044 family protein [Campylobacterota bacterium]
LRIIAIYGMYLLLNKYIFNYKDKQYSILISLTFSILPFWPSGGLSVAGLPLITYSFLNIHKNNSNYKDWLTLMIFPFYSSFILSMMFYILLLGIFWLYSLKSKKINIYFTLSIFIFISLYVLTNYRLFEAFLFSSDFVSHRVERVNEYKTFFESLSSSMKHFIKGQYHAHSLHVILLPFIFFVFTYSIIKKRKNTLLNLLILLNVSISIWYGFWKYEGWEEIKNSISLLNSLNLSRIHFLTPLIWYISFALSVKYFIDNIKYKHTKTIILLLISVQVLYLYSKSDFVKTFKKTDITYSQFYSEKLFSDIDNYIQTDKSKYKIVSIGIHPSIARYNGFYTADGYLSNYSLEYKHKFRKVIEKELDKNKKLKKSFDNWGSRCYLFLDEVGYNFERTKEDTYPIKIDIDAQALRDLDVEFIFSSYEIKNANINQLKFIELFTDEESAWDIYLYQVLE